MVEIVTAVYEKGMLRPLQPLNLRERQRVRIRVVPEDSDVSKEPVDDTDVLIQRLVAKGLMRPRPRGPIPPDPVSAEERLRLADIMGQAPGKPLSEIIIEERGEW
ncbi:MAG: antitoxin family protein [Anaerolineae bacterium]|nr:antitoxin family protein [Anaerolineae bacterium]